MLCLLCRSWSPALGVPCSWSPCSVSLPPGPQFPVPFSCCCCCSCCWPPVLGPPFLSVFPCSWFPFALSAPPSLVFCSLCPIPGVLLFMVSFSYSCSWFPVPGFLSLASCSWSPVSGLLLLAPFSCSCSCSPVTGFLFLVSCALPSFPGPVPCF